VINRILVKVHPIRRFRLSLMFLVAVTAAGCEGPPVTLLTGQNPFTDGEPGMVGCYTNFAVGELEVDATYGTAITDESIGGTGPVRWPTGYSGRHSGSEVEVLDRDGQVVARTGNRYQIEGAFVGDGPRAWLACGYVLPK